MTSNEFETSFEEVRPFKLIIMLTLFAATMLLANTLPLEGGLVFFPESSEIDFSGDEVEEDKDTKSDRSVHDTDLGLFVCELYRAQVSVGDLALYSPHWTEVYLL